MDASQEFKERITSRINDAYQELKLIGTKYNEYKDADGLRDRDRTAHAARWASWVSDRRKEYEGHLAEINAKGLAVIYPNYRDARIEVKTFAAVEINNALQVDVSLTESTLERFLFAINAGRSPEYIFSLASRLETLTPGTPDELEIHGKMRKAFAQYQERTGLTAIEAERKKWEQAGSPLKKFEAEVKLGLFSPDNIGDLQKVLREAGLA